MANKVVSALIGATVVSCKLVPVLPMFALPNGAKEREMRRLTRLGAAELIGTFFLLAGSHVPLFAL